MIRLMIIFSVTFAIGALAAVVLRTSTHRPHASSETAPASPVVAPMAAPPGSVASVSVNTICVICGMPVDPALGTALYHEKPIGFGCKTCPAQFAADPEKYGPSALKNVMVQ